jgi:hypothetical protein
MLRRAFLLATLLSLGCSSGDFDVADTNDAANNNDVSNDGDPGETSSSDTAPGPCDPEPDKAKYCIEVKLAKLTHPPYNTASGAVGLNIDGTGRILVALWDRDPTLTPPGSPEPPPKIVTPYPSETGELNIDRDLPITIAGSAEPAEYTVMGFFADNLKDPRPAGSILPGDFVMLPNVSDGKLVYPKMTLSKGTVQKVSLELRPNRRVSVTLGFSESFLTYVKTQPTVHGDGPVMFGLFDGALGSSTAWLNLDFSNCVATNVQTLPNAPIIDFMTTVEGEHNVYMTLFDYGSTPFPGKGSLTSTPTAPYPRLNITPDTWTASATVDLTSIPLGAYPKETAPVDKLTCP